MKIKLVIVFLVMLLLSSCSPIDTSRPHYIIGSGLGRQIIYADKNLCSSTKLMDNPIHVRCVLSDKSIVEYETDYFELVSPEEK